MSKRITKKKERFRKEMLGAHKPGDLVPMPDHQREFLRIRGKYVHNPVMEAILAADKDRETSQWFSSTPLPWETPLSHTDEKHLQAARNREFACRNKDCSRFNTLQKVDYAVIIHKKELSQEKYGRSEQVNFHCEARCQACRQRIQFVKLGLANRRAAKDPTVSGPHQNRR